MLDLTELDDSIKLRSLGRMMTSNHPLTVQIRNKLNFNNYLKPSCETQSDTYLNKALGILSRVRIAGASDTRLEGNRILIGLLKNIPLRDLINANGKSSLAYFRIRQLGATQIGDLNPATLNTIERFFNDRRLTYRLVAETLRTGDWRRPTESDKLTIPGKGTLYDIRKTSAKAIRTLIFTKDPICLFKSGIILDPISSINYFNKVSKLTSVAHRNTLLRALHGDIYTNERLFRFGMRDNPQCTRCNSVDTLEHRLNECPRVIDIVNALTQKTLMLGDRAYRLNVEIRDHLMATYSDVDVITLTLHAEVTRLVCSTSELTNPTSILDRMIKMLIKKESDNEIKNQLTALLHN